VSTQSPPTEEHRTPTGKPIGPFLLWFGVLGGTVAWVVQLMVGWSTTEVSCYAPTGADVANHGGTLGTVSSTVVWATTITCWVVAWAAFAACLLVRRRRRRLAEAGTLDLLATERVALLTVVGIFLDLMAVAIITGGAVALLVLEPCG